MFKPGQDVLVDFDGEGCRGEVLDSRNGWVLARVMIDHTTDHYGVSPEDLALSPDPIVMVRDGDVRPVDAPEV